MVSREALLIEISRLRGQLDDALAECAMLREAMAPLTRFPGSWGLTGAEASLLSCLIRAKGATVPRERIMVQMYGLEPDVEVKIIDVLVCKIRRKLKSYGVEIKSHWGQGYFLTLESLATIRTAAAAEPLEMAA